MALSSAFCRSFYLLAFLAYLNTVTCAIISYDFDITWVWANPDGNFARPVIGINDQWPLPVINATIGDNLIVNVHNSLGNQSTSLHFHGLFQNGTNHMDGVSQVTQCAITPGSSYTYNFTVQQPGTYWYHSHQEAQYPDGLRGVLVVDDPEHPYKSQYDEEIALSVSDWYYKQTPDLLVGYGAMSDPSPDANLINDTTNAEIKIDTGKTYLIHMVNVGAFIGQFFWIQDHTLTVVEVDGVYTEAKDASMLYIGPGQRYSFLVTIAADQVENIPIVTRMDETSFSMHGAKPKDIFGRGWLMTGRSESLPVAEKPKKSHHLNDLILTPLDQQPLLGPVDRNISLNIDMHSIEGVSHWMFNDVNYEVPEMPSLFAALAAGTNATSPELYSKHTHTYVLERDEIIEVQMKNKHSRRHPVHLHGHNFQITHRSGGALNDTPADKSPLRRDTIVVNSHGTLRFRFKASNPGVWIFHCHMEWHAQSGLMATFVEAPLDIQRDYQHVLTIPTSLNASDVCQSTVSFDGDSTIKEGKEEYIITHEMAFAGLGVLLAVIALFGAGRYVWYRWRRPAEEDHNYTLVPVMDADNIELDKENNDR